jgi:toxin ParE1/3/4
MQFHVTQKAEEDLDKIFAYWAQRSGIDVADRLVDSIEDRFALLGDYPLVGRKCDEIAPDVFRFLAGDYLIYYRKRRSIIYILHVFHGARDQARTYRSD